MRLAAGAAETGGGVSNYRESTRMHGHLTVKHLQAHTVLMEIFELVAFALISIKGRRVLNSCCFALLKFREF